MSRRWLVAIVTLGACGRVSFDPLGADATEGSTDAPGGPTVLADWSSSNPYNSQDFYDSVAWAGNEPRALAALSAPFADGFAVSIGTAILEIHMGGAIVVHDYRPATAEAGGPDNISRLSQGAAPDSATGALWFGAASWNAGDGLFRIDATGWTLTRETMSNNISGVAFDPAGAFDGLGVDVIYFAAGNRGIERRNDALGSSTNVWSTAAEVGNCAVSPDAIYVTDAISDTDPDRLHRIDSVTHAATQIDQSTHIVLAQGPVASGVIGIRDNRTLEHWDPSGGHTVLASSPDASTRWLDVVIPRPPHPLAGRMIVLEWNVDTDRQRILLMP